MEVVLCTCLILCVLLWSEDWFSRIFLHNLSSWLELRIVKTAQGRFNPPASKQASHGSEVSAGNSQAWTRFELSFEGFPTLCPFWLPVFWLKDEKIDKDLESPCLLQQSPVSKVFLNFGWIWYGQGHHLSSLHFTTCQAPTLGHAVLLLTGFFCWAMSGAANEATGLFFPQLLHDFAVNPAQVGLASWQHKIRYQIY